MRRPSVLQLPTNPYERLMAIATFVSFAGTGLFFGAGTIFLVRSVGLSPSEVGTALSIGGLAGLVAGVVIGDQADRRGAREVVVIATLVEAVARGALLGVHGTLALALVAAVGASGAASATSARGALIGIIAEEGQGARLRTSLRAVTNLGLAVGTVGAAVVLAIDTRGAYVTMILLDACSFVAAAALFSRLPRFAPTRAAGAEEDRGPRWVALRDRRYLALTVAASVASLQYFIPTLALPLWVTLHTDAPRWMAAVLFLIAALIVAAIQVPATRSIDGPRSAARSMARSGFVFIVAWAVIAEAARPGPVVACALLVVGIAVHSLAEVWQAGGAFELSFSLARPEAQGQYQGVFGLSMGLAEAVAPIAVIGLCVTWGEPGWLLLGAVITGAGLACALIERRSRTAPVAKAVPEVG